MTSRARAPGKVVVSGAYAVLEGAPSIVAAVDRYVVADAARPAHFLTPEVRAAIGDTPAPFFDAEALRDAGQKLGLGSSAAILVASLAALALKKGDPLDGPSLETIFETALLAHRAAQGGGSGIDVAASVFGEVLHVRLREGALERRPLTLPDVHLEVWASAVPASTAELLTTVRGLRDAARSEYEALMSELSSAADQAILAADGGDPAAFVHALSAQGALLARLGREAGAPIVTEAVHVLSSVAGAHGAVVLPAGAGGGDIVLYAGLTPPASALREEAVRSGHRRLDLVLGARGVHAVPDIEE